MSDYGASDTSTTVLGANQFPINEVYVPGVGLKAMGGGPVHNDGSKDYTSALVSFADTSNSNTLTTDGDTASVTLTGGQGTVIIQILTSNLNGTLLFEASPDGGTTYWPIIGDQIGANISASSVVGTGGVQAQSLWSVNIAGFTNFHVKLHPTTSGSAAVIVRVSQSVRDVKVNNAAALGQSTMTASASVAIASDQTPVPIKRSAVAAYTLASTTTSGSTQNSGDIAVGAYTEISIDINTTAQAGTSPTIQYFYERKGADGIYYVLWQSAVLTSATNTISTSIGAGMAYNQSLGLTGRLRWVIGGSSTPTFTHSLNVYGK